jgi:hypothetical protein
MERRSTRGRTSSTSTSESPSPTKMPALEQVPEPEVPEIGGEEVVLNRRGMVRNKFTFCHLFNN